MLGVPGQKLGEKMLLLLTGLSFGFVLGLVACALFIAWFNEDQLEEKDA